MEENKKILVIDDDPETVDFIKNVLRQAGYEVYAASRGQDGMALLKKVKPELILLDLVLPDQSGFQVGQKIKSISRYKDIPIIAISLKKDDIDKHIAAKSGFLAYLEKPLTSAALLFQVADIFKK
jgi:two-component system alkaline phosphatase synthesis response regulator PhoP